MSFYPLSLLEMSARVITLEERYHESVRLYELGQRSMPHVTGAREAWVGAKMALGVETYKFRERETQRPPVRKMYAGSERGEKADLIFALVDVRVILDRLNHLASMYQLRGGIPSELAKLSGVLDQVEATVPILRALRATESHGEILADRSAGQS